MQEAQKSFNLEARISEKGEMMHAPSVVHHKHNDDSKKVPVFVMLPLDTVTFEECRS
ncbi:putative beta-amylase [Lupinus albus]|uniref:Putative beta-amylase n=1 Tax=Lupinus albus TaxID=3870 RepID=A0A6A4QH82_LUPAL|nr:putative beta-amylase [Lupinus albus]